MKLFSRNLEIIAKLSQKESNLYKYHVELAVRILKTETMIILV